MSVKISDCLRDDVVRGEKELASQYQTARPFRHLVMDDFFQPGFCQALLDDFPAFDRTRAMNENGEVGGKCVHENLAALSEPYQQLDTLIQGDEFLDWLGRVTGIEGLLFDPDYFGGGTHENRHGQDLDPHVDFNRHPRSGWHRRLNLIVYLNTEWQVEWGGAIEFHSDPRLPADENEIRTVQPAFNRAVLFETTHWSWHGFERINLPEGDSDQRSRKSVALYFYSEDRPAEEQTKPHSTIYVERPLPDHIRPGQLLTEQDFKTVQRLLARRDQHLQRLYNNISDLNQQVDDLIEFHNRMLTNASGRYAVIRGIGALRRFVLRGRRWLARRIMP